MSTLQIRNEVERLKAKLAGSSYDLSWEARELLRMYAEGLTGWQRGKHKRHWRINFREALNAFGREFASSKGPGPKTLYWLMFMTRFRARGGADSEKSRQDTFKFWLLSRRVAPKQVEDLLLEGEDEGEGKDFIILLDETWKKILEAEQRC